MITIDDVRRIAMSLPGVEERPSYGGRPSWRTPARMFAWVRDDPEALVVWLESIDEKEAVLASAADHCFTTPHDDDTPIVLVDLARVDHERARELIVDSWRVRAPERVVAGYDDAH